MSMAARRRDQRGESVEQFEWREGAAISGAISQRTKSFR
jgi:hypothetical protein